MGYEHRTFQVWFYSTSHGQLLLRSHRKSVGEKRIEILFTDVHALNLRTLNIRGLVIREAEPGEWTEPVEQFDAELRCFLLQSDGWSGYIVAGSLHWVEEYAGMTDPSSLLTTPETDAVRHLFP